MERTFTIMNITKPRRSQSLERLQIPRNTGAIKVGEMVGKENLHDYLKAFGVGSSVGLKLPGETAGKLLDLDQWSGTSLPTFSFGQGYSLNSIQATSIFATLANDGVRVQPTVIKGTISASGAIHSNGTSKARSSHFQ